VIVVYKELASPHLKPPFPEPDSLKSLVLSFPPLLQLAQSRRHRRTPRETRKPENEKENRSEWIHFSL